MQPERGPNRVLPPRWSPEATLRPKRPVEASGPLVREASSSLRGPPSDGERPSGRLDDRLNLLRHENTHSVLASVLSVLKCTLSDLE